MESEGGGPHGCAAWASGWGEDTFGVWAELAVEGVNGGEESVTAPRSVVQRLRWIPPGEFWMGSEDDDNEAFPEEKPRHKVRMTRGYWLGDTPVTQEFYTAVVGENPSWFADKVDWSRRPVEGVGWHMARVFLRQLDAQVVQRVGRDLAGGDRMGFRLPTEAEWEYACRSGTRTPRYGPSEKVAWYDENSAGQTQPVGLRAPSPWGLFDMLGNVWEWCADGEGPAYPFEAPIDPAVYTGPKRNIRGGSWDGAAYSVRAAFRNWSDPGCRDGRLGFRLARGPTLPPAPPGWENGE